MRKVTSDFKNQIERDNRNYYEWVDITLKDGTVLNLTNQNIWNSGIKIEDAVSDTSEFQIGTAIINKATVTLNNLYDDFTDYDFDEAKIVIYIGYNIDNTILYRVLQDTTGKNILDTTGNEIATLVNGSIVEKVKMFTGTVVNSPYQNSSLITLTCEDNMLLFDRDYSESKLIYPATRAQILRDACEVCGVSLETLTFDNSDYIVNTRPSDEKLTFRQVIAWTAQLGGQFLRCNSDGKLCCGWYDLKNYESDTVNEEYFDVIASNSSVTVNSEDVIITGIQVTAYQENQSEKEADDTSLYGKTGYVIAIADNKLIEKGTAGTVAAMIGERVAGMRFRPFSASTLNNPTYEAGDICIIKDRKGASYKSFLTSSTFQVGKYHTVQCGAKSAAKNSSKQYSVFSQAQVENRKNFQREKTEREKAVEEFNKALDSASGMFPTEVKQEDGSTILYVHDKKTLEDSKNVFKITSDAVGFSTDGGKTYPFGFTINGDFLTRILYAIGINADYINTGAITVKDSDGNIIFQADIANKRVIISGDYVQIGGKTATDAIKDANSTASSALTAAQNARNMTLQLSNDYYSVNVDSNGKYSKFPTDVTTKAQVMYGANDITSECAFSITKSDNISGTWDSAKHQYTVTALTADTGWVNIQATYLSKLTVTKQFTVAKLYAGAKGTPGRTYFIELSSRVLKRSKDNTIAPNFFTIKGFYRDGNSTTRVAYNGRFTIEETNDGNTWKRVYTSPADESSVTHSLYTAIATGTGTNSVIGDGKGNAIGFPRDTIAVRCTMYASGGTTTALDVQDCAILVDVDALTQEDVFDALTDNGATKGIYKEGNQLYINATYMQIGKIASKNKRVYFDLDNNELACSKMIDRSTEAHIIDGVKYENLQLNMQEINASNTKTYGILMSKEGKEDIGMLFTPSASEDKCNQIRFGKGILIGENSVFASIQIKNYAFGTNNTKVYDDDVTIHGSNKNACWFEIGYDRIGMFENAGPSITINKQKNVWNIPNYKPRNPVEIHGNTYLSSNLVVSGTKNRCVDTDNYGTKLQYCYEMSSPYFGDIGSGVLDETGECYVNVDDIFSETICLNFEYHVFLQKEGSGDIWVEEKQNMFFVVKGTPGLKFSWEIKAKQKDYETERLEDKEGYPTIVDSDYENDGFEEIENYIKSQEEYTL